MEYCSGICGSHLNLNFVSFCVEKRDVCQNLKFFFIHSLFPLQPHVSSVGSLGKWIHFKLPLKTVLRGPVGDHISGLES